MPHVTGTIPNLVNGISQQAPQLRLPSQGAASDNFYPTIVDGLVPRPRTDHLALINVDLPAGTFVHTILRDDAEKYVLTIQPSGALRIWDIQAGIEQTVTNNGAAYLAGLTNPAEQLRGLTIADYTFVTNRTRVVAAAATTAPLRYPEALIPVLAGNYAKTYTIYINGVAASTYTTPDGSIAAHGAYIDTTYLASILLSGLATSLGGAPNWAYGRYNNTNVLINIANVDFTVSVDDGYAGRAMRACKDVVSKFSDLPANAYPGFKIRVQGDKAEIADDYWVEYQTVNGSQPGVWRETVAPGARTSLNAATMPHQLVRNANGTWTFGPAPWGLRECGDEASVPWPSFVGQKIEDLFFHRNRLGFLTAENIVMSRAGSFYQFFRQTLTALLDTDPIDVAASHVKVSLLRHAVPYNETLLVFSDQTQFRLDGNELLTPKTVNCKPLSELGSIRNIRPVVAGQSLYFVAEGAGWASLYEYFIDKTIQSADDENVAGHAPAYVPAGVRNLVASPDLDLVLLQSSGDPSAVYVYKFHWNGQEKLQSAWCRWSFPGVDQILNVAFDKKTAIMTLKRGSVVTVERLNAEQGYVDPGVDYVVYLDRQVRLDGAAASYNASADETTFTLPYAIPAGLKCVTAPGGSTPAGVEDTPKRIAGSTVVFEGDRRGDKFRFGIEYTCRYRFSPFFFRGQDGKLAQTDGRLQVLTLTVNFSKSSYFRVEVANEGRPLRSYPYTGREVGSPRNQTGALVVSSGKVSVPIFSRSDRTTIELVNDTWRPCSFTSAVWAGTWNPTNRQT